MRALRLGLLISALALPAQAQIGPSGGLGLPNASGAFTCTSAGVCTLNPVSAVATSLSIGGATIGSNALAVTGTGNISGQLQLGNGTSAVPSIAIGSASSTGLWRSNVSEIGITLNGSTLFNFFAGAIAIGSAQEFAWTSGTDPSVSGRDLRVTRDAPNSHGWRNGVNAQRGCVYNTFTDASNYERGCLDWITTANILSIGSVAAGTGTLRNISLVGGTVSVANTTDSSSTATGSFQVAGGAVVIKRFWIPGITASAGLQTAVLCQSSTGEMIADSVACLASAKQVKDEHDLLPNGALAKLMKLPIGLWSYKSEGLFTSNDWIRERIGPYADDVEKMDRRLVGYGNDGKIRTYSTEQLLGYTIKALQEAVGRIEQLEQR